MRDDHTERLRLKSMLGTALLAAGIIGAIAYLFTGAIWIAAAALISVAVAVILLSQVGKSLS